jgi:hypothetical protein
MESWVDLKVLFHVWSGVLARTPAGSCGNAPKDVFRGPGINHWDISIFKTFPIREKMSAQF